MSCQSQLCSTVYILKPSQRRSHKWTYTVNSDMRSILQPFSATEGAILGRLQAMWVGWGCSLGVQLLELRERPKLLREALSEVLFIEACGVNDFLHLSNKDWIALIRMLRRTLPFELSNWDSRLASFDAFQWLHRSTLLMLPYVCFRYPPYYSLKTIRGGEFENPKRVEVSASIRIDEIVSCIQSKSMHLSFWRVNQHLISKAIRTCSYSFSCISSPLNRHRNDLHCRQCFIAVQIHDRAAPSYFFLQIEFLKVGLDRLSAAKMSLSTSGSTSNLRLWYSRS